MNSAGASPPPMFSVRAITTCFFSLFFDSTPPSPTLPPYSSYRNCTSSSSAIVRPLPLSSSTAPNHFHNLTIAHLEWWAPALISFPSEFRHWGTYTTSCSEPSAAAPPCPFRTMTVMSMCRAERPGRPDLTGFTTGLGQLKRPTLALWPIWWSRLPAHRRCGLAPKSAHWPVSIILILFNFC
jgi:hypothetical protein